MAACLPEVRSCPRCESHFLNSSLLEETGSHVRLRCNACDNEFSLLNTLAQREHLQNVHGAPSQIDQLIHISQLKEGDVIVYKRVAWVLKYEHHAVVTEVNEHKGIVTVVEFAPELPLRKGVIVRSERNFNDDIATQNAWVRRYMPLDALPVPEVLSRANAFVLNRESQPRYDITRCNCQHLSSWCKTGKFRSAQAGTARLIYFFTFHGIQIISIFINPVATIGLCVLDTSIRVGRMIRSDVDLVKKEMVTWDVVLKDIASVAITVVVGVAALALVASAISKKQKNKS